jgi:hypothetical protein
VTLKDLLGTSDALRTLPLPLVVSPSPSSLETSVGHQRATVPLVSLHHAFRHLSPSLRADPFSFPPAEPSVHLPSSSPSKWLPMNAPRPARPTCWSV